MASNIQLLKSFVDGQGAGASTYVAYDADLDANFVEIEAGFNALNAEFQAFAGANSLIALDLALSTSPSVTEGFIGTDSFQPVAFLSSDTQIQIPVGVAFTAAVGRVESLQTYTFTGSGGAGTRYFALQETGLVTQETAAGQGVLDLYSVPWDGAAFTTASLSRLPTSGSIIVDGDDFQNTRAQEDISQGSNAIIPPFTYDRIDYRVSDALRILAGIPSAGSATSSQPSASGGPAGPSLKPAAIGGSMGTPGLILGNPSDGYDVDSGVFGTPATPALGVAIAGSTVATFGAASLDVPRAVAVTAPTPWAYLQENVQTGASYNQVAADVGRVIVGNNGSAITVNLLAAATAGAGYVFVAKNIGAGNMTLDPSGAETIEGVSTLVLTTGETAIVWTEGSLWRASVSGSDAGTWTQLQENVQTGSSYTQVAGDVGTAIIGNNGTAITIDLLAVATAGAGYVFVAKNIGAGDMTLDPNGAETIDGAATLVLATNEAAIVWCNGTTWRVISGTGGGGGGAWSDLQESIKTGSSYTQVAGDAGTAIIGNNGTAITIDLLAVATAGAGYLFVAKNIGAGDMTLDPNSTEQIEGADTYVLRQGEAAIVWCNGSLWRVFPYLLTREILTADRTYYVRTDGSDANDGLTNSAGGAFLTIQKAFDTIGNLDLGVQTVTIQLGNTGTYAGATMSAAHVGGPGSEVELVGDVGSASSYVISSNLVADGKADFAVRGVDLTSSNFGLRATGAGSRIRVNGVTVFGACTNAQVIATNNASIEITSNVTIDGNAPQHIYATNGGFIFEAAVTVTLTGTPAFTEFAKSEVVSAMQLNGNTYSGSATGSRYNANLNGVINTLGGGATYLPGNAAGTTATGGQYA